MGIINAPLPDGKYQFANFCGDPQFAVAGALAAADLVQTAKFGPPAVYANTDRFAKAPSARGVGSADGRLPAMASRHAAVAEANGVEFDQNDQLVFRKSWFAKGRTVSEQLAQVMHFAAAFESTLHVAAYRANAFDVRLEDARRTACSGFAAHSFPVLRSRLEGAFLLPLIEIPPSDAAGGHVSAAEILSAVH